jgi:hypothetical protein
VRGESTYDPLGWMHRVWLGIIITGLIVLVAALAAASSIIFV